jgi:uncharacterized membrane-anchored protein
MRKILGCLAAALLLVGAARAATSDTLTPDQQALVKKYQAIAATLHPQRGDVALTSAHATLHLGQDYYFLPADQARRVLVDAWRNPPEAVSDVMGMVFPSGRSFADDTWAAVITYQDSGYVTDTDAKSTDYGKILQQAREGEDARNEKRKSEGLPSLHLVGWAQAPYYDAPHHTLVWARELQFGDRADHSLNYDLRALGRHGVLSMNIVSHMSRIADTRQDAAKLQNVGTFDPGARYQDYKEGTDKKAGYGIAGLVAAAVGVVVAKKLGLLAIGLLFAKKFVAVIVAAFAGGAAWLRRLFGRKTPPALP